jgi:pyridoxal phosphate enzyme (YggS family)
VAVADRLEEVWARIARAGGERHGITLVAVTKGFGRDAVDQARAAGIADFGENYADELLAKQQAGDGDERWHYLGPVQHGTVKRLGGRVWLWHAFDREHAARGFDRHAPGARVLVQVNVSGEPQKAGCAWDDAPALVEALRARGLDVRGLMAVGPTGPPEQGRPGFRRLAALARELELAELSMGMTDDLEVAVQEGATIVRLGSVLYG